MRRRPSTAKKINHAKATSPIPNDDSEETATRNWRRTASLQTRSPIPSTRAVECTYHPSPLLHRRQLCTSHSLSCPGWNTGCTCTSARLSIRLGRQHPTPHTKASSLVRSVNQSCTTARGQRFPLALTRHYGLFLQVIPLGITKMDLDSISTPESSPIVGLGRERGQRPHNADSECRAGSCMSWLGSIAPA